MDNDYDDDDDDAVRPSGTLTTVQGRQDEHQGKMGENAASTTIAINETQIYSEAASPPFSFFLTNMRAARTYTNYTRTIPNFLCI